MIRINLLGQAKPKASRRPVDTGAALPLLFVGAGVLLDEIASTVARTENLWLTSMIRKGNNLTLDGASASVNGVANFITALKRSGYFSKIEIKESKQDEKNTAVQTFVFEVYAEITPPAAGVAPPRAQAKPASAPTQPAPKSGAPAKVG
jgi:Tfp pilus assembly protein PilN